MTTATCDHCDCVGPAGATRVSPRVPDRNNVPAVHTHVAVVGDHTVYDSHGCDYCDSPWAMAVAVDLDMELANYGVETAVYCAYEMTRYGAYSDGKKTSKAVKAMVADARPTGPSMKMVNVCPACHEANAHEADRTVPVAGETCYSPAVRDAMVATATAWAEWDKAEANAWTNHGGYYSRDGSHGPCPY